MHWCLQASGNCQSNGQFGVAWSKFTGGCPYEREVGGPVFSCKDFTPPSWDPSSNQTISRNPGCPQERACTMRLPTGLFPQRAHVTGTILHMKASNPNYSFTASSVMTATLALMVLAASLSRANGEHRVSAVCAHSGEHKDWTEIVAREHLFDVCPLQESGEDRAEALRVREGLRGVS